jgi:rubrerythrin
MALSTFGAIMGFAAEMAGQTKVTYEALSEKAKDAALKEVLQQLAVEEGKTHSLMERTRREHVTEMILEPITGLYKKDYELDLRHGEQKDDADVLKVALMLEEREKRFFEDASAKVPLPEVARIFRKISRKKEETLEKLRAHA